MENSKNYNREYEALLLGVGNMILHSSEFFKEPIHKENFVEYFGKDFAGYSNTSKCAMDLYKRIEKNINKLLSDKRIPNYMLKGILSSLK